MPVQKGKSSFFASTGEKGKQAFLKARDNPVKIDAGGRLPAGIEGGIARLKGISTDGVFESGPNKGKPYFRAWAVVLKPDEHNGVRTKGKQTSIIEPLCDTKKGDGTVVTLQQHYDNIVNHLKLLGLDTTGMSPDEVDAGVAALIEAEPTFEFRTWKGNATPQFPDPRVNEVWLQACEYHDDENDGVNDDSPAADHEPEPDADNAGDEPPDSGDADTAADDVPDYDALGTAADEGDEEAATTLKSLAMDAGWSEDKIDAVEKWSDLAAALANGEGPPEDEPENEEWKPVKDDVYMVRLTDPATKKPAKKPTECMVMNVYEKDRTVTLKNLDTGKLVVDPKTKVAVKFKWDDLPRE